MNMTNRPGFLDQRAGVGGPASMPGTPGPFTDSGQTAPGGPQTASAVLTPTPVAVSGGTPFRVTKG